VPEQTHCRQRMNSGAEANRLAFAEHRICGLSPLHQLQHRHRQLFRLHMSACAAPFVWWSSFPLRLRSYTFKTLSKYHLFQEALRFATPFLLLWHSLGDFYSIWASLLEDKDLVLFEFVPCHKRIPVPGSEHMSTFVWIKKSRCMEAQL
jgi:hypothetical protein